MRETLWDKVRMHMNAHPKLQRKAIMQLFRDDDDNVISGYYYDWKKYVEPVANFYKIIQKKFAPHRKIHEKDVRVIKKIEKLLEPKEYIPEKKNI